MALQTISGRDLKVAPVAVSSTLPELASNIRHVGRRPILDRRGEVHGYELLFWNGHQPALGEESELASHALLGQAIAFGVEEMTSGFPAFVHCAPESLAAEWVHALRPALMILELKASALPAPALLDACRKLKQKGFRLVLDDYTREYRTSPLIELADYLKMDINCAGPMEKREFPTRQGQAAAHPVAKNVETQADYAKAIASGFELFQGYYFCRPEPATNYKMPPNRLVHMEILEVLQRDPVDIRRLTQLVMCDASLTYRLLRLVNSPVCAMRQEVTSIQSALMLLGVDTARRMAMLAIAGDFNSDQPVELLHMALERGRFCELAAGLLKLDQPEQYLIGMVSMFPAMLGITAKDLVKLLPLRTDAANALLGKRNREGAFLDFLMSQERGDWSASDAILQTHAVKYEQIARPLAESVTWANTALRSTH